MILAPCDFWLFPKLTGYGYETIEEMKEAVTKVIDTLTQEDFHGAFQKLLERYNKCIAAGGDYFEGDWSFMCVLSIKVPIRKKSGKLFNDPRNTATGIRTHCDIAAQHVSHNDTISLMSRCAYPFFDGNALILFRGYIQRFLSSVDWSKKIRKRKQRVLLDYEIILLNWRKTWLNMNQGKKKNHWK